jgi:hypothetical protein
MDSIRLTHDLRQELRLVVRQANRLFKALQALPDTEEAMREALRELSQQERRQAAHYFARLSQHCYHLHLLATAG